MKLIISASIVVTCMLAGVVLAVALPAPKFVVSAQPTGSTVVIDQLKTTQTGFIFIEGSEYGKVLPGVIGIHDNPLEPGTYKNISIPVGLSDNPLVQVGKVYVTFVPDRNKNGILDPGDYVKNPLYRIFSTTTIDRW